MKRSAKDMESDGNVKTGKTTLRPLYESRRIQVTSVMYEDFRRMEHARPLRHSRITELIALFLSGIVPDGVIILNSLGDEKHKRYRVIDGNHRLTALGAFFEKNPNANVWLDFHVYHDLTKEQEFEVFERASTVVPINRNDRIGIRQDSLPMWKWMQKEFPCAVTMYKPTVKEALAFPRIIRAYEARFTRFAGVTDHARISRMTESQYDEIRQAVGDFIAAYGKPTPHNQYLQPEHALAANMKVYFCNVEKHGREEIISRLQHVVGDSEVRDAIRSYASHIGSRVCCEKILLAVNRGYSKPGRLFVDPAGYAEMRKKAGGSEA